MAKVYLEHNPFSGHTKCTIDGKDVSQKDDFLRCWGNPNKSFLQDWVGEFFQRLHDIENDDKYEVEFFGLPSDYRDLENVKDKFCEENSGIKINLVQKGINVKSSEERVRQLRALFDEMQKNSPYDELKTKELRENFSNALGDEEEIGVVATVSSGKSTLLNAILHEDLLPARNQPTTAVVAKIYNDKSKHEFRVSATDRDGNFICDDIVGTPEILDKLNSNKEVSDLKLFGNIPNIKEYGLRVVFSDTPGPNNSGDDTHKQHTYKLIGQIYKPMILYVLNAGQPQVTDDKNLLNDIAQEMKKSGIQSKDRFIFVLNKVDELNTQKGENAYMAIKNLREYLKTFDIDNPKIFPISAYLSKVARLKQNRKSLLSDDENDFLDTKGKRFIENEERHLYKFAPLSNEGKQILDAIIKDAKDKNDELAFADICSGVPALEIAINEYVEKYAIRQKIKLSIETFKNFIENKAIKAKSINNISKSGQNREEIIRTLESIEQKLKDGHRAKLMEERIREFDFINSANQFLNKEKEELVKILGKLSNVENDMDEAGAKKYISDFKDQLKHFSMRFIAQIDEKINLGLLKDIEEMYEEYKNYAKSIISESSDFGKAFIGEISVESLVDVNLDINNTFNSFKKTIKEERTYSTGNIDKAWYKFWTWFDDEYKIHKYTTEKEIFNAKGFLDEMIQNIYKNFSPAMDEVRDKILENSREFKDKFLNDIKRLKKAMENNTNKQIELLRNKDKLEEAVALENQNIKWLDDFSGKLDRVLEI